MKLAAIDIGSNAIRMQISKVFVHEDKSLSFKKLEYVRFPLRLGQDVFSTKKISPATEEKFIKLMSAFKTLIDLYEVDDYFACATSAMRESKNGIGIAERALKETGLQINIIDGKEEASLINNVISHNLTESPTVHIDVGGGSTELNFYFKKQKIATKSFKIGSVRNMSAQNDDKWAKMKDWIKGVIEENSIQKLDVSAIGTGGNIKKIYELSLKTDGKPISLKKVKKIKSYIASFTYEERLSKLMLNPDRADVIIPASNIYINVMKWSHAKKIMVPEVGLKDGIIEMLYNKNKNKVPVPTLS